MVTIKCRNLFLLHYCCWCRESKSPDSAITDAYSTPYANKYESSMSILPLIRIITHSIMFFCHYFSLNSHKSVNKWMERTHHAQLFIANNMTFDWTDAPNDRRRRREKQKICAANLSSFCRSAYLLQRAPAHTAPIIDAAQRWGDGVRVWRVRSAGNN